MPQTCTLGCHVVCILINILETGKLGVRDGSQGQTQAEHGLRVFDTESNPHENKLIRKLANKYRTGTRETEKGN